MPKNGDWKATLATGVLFYQGLVHTVGVQSTDGGVTAWLLMQSIRQALYDPSSTILKMLGRGYLMGAILNHGFKDLENMPTLNQIIDKFFKIPEFQPKAT